MLNDYSLFIDKEDLTKLSSISMVCVKEIKPGELDYVQLQNAMLILALSKLMKKLGMDQVITLHDDLLIKRNEDGV